MAHHPFHHMTLADFEALAEGGDHRTLIQFVRWNDRNGDYPHEMTCAELIEVIRSQLSGCS